MTKKLAKKHLKKIMAGITDDFLKLTYDDLYNGNNVPYEIAQITENKDADNLREANAAFAKQAIEEYIFNHSEESDDIAKAIYGDNYMEYFDDSIDSYIKDVADIIVNKCEYIDPKKLPETINAIIDKIIEINNEIDNA